MRTMILCLGHERLLGDDLAAHVGRALKELPLPPDMLVRIALHLDWECVDDIIACDQLILVDGMVSGNEPGTCLVEELKDNHSSAFRLYCRHRHVVNDIVELSHLLAQEGAAKHLVFIGIELGGRSQGRDTFPPRRGSTVPTAVDFVLRAFGAEVALRRMVDHACASLDDAAFVDDAWASLLGAA